jgi:crotonobetainyl-CoA:carnitine CoA-transferase CaiB-like acyl-CoA transferase
VRTLDRVYDWDQTRSQGLLVDVEHATAGPITLPGPPLRFDDGRRVTHTGAADAGPARRVGAPLARRGRRAAPRHADPPVRPR